MIAQILTAVALVGAGVIIGIIIGQATDRPTGNVLLVLLATVVCSVAVVWLSPPGWVLLSVLAGAFVAVITSMVFYSGSYGPVEPVGAERFEPSPVTGGMAELPPGRGRTVSLSDLRRLLDEAQGTATEQDEREQQLIAARAAAGSPTAELRLAAIEAFDLEQSRPVNTFTDPDPDPAPDDDGGDEVVWVGSDTGIKPGTALEPAATGTDHLTPELVDDDPDDQPDQPDTDDGGDELMVLGDVSAYSRPITGVMPTINIHYTGGVEPLGGKKNRRGK